ncbi:hypothetical protein SAMN05446037_101368 [Anaerovirgula multivorans]|uniref:Uncharacterized protein n=1 Tax=Anaerovirgula multivorans TaxID=312168 RepID=A0A239FMN5_9FIRM|nr:hypothetical protein [Anaerovirgula multivorans]SNS57473.1 hypothetical protein SAMN05446037_101368 [Anaerovirgula multivorans]
MIDIDKLCSAMAIAIDALVYINVLRLFIKIPRDKMIKLYLLTFISATIIVTIHDEMQYLYYLKSALLFTVLGIINRLLLNIRLNKNAFVLFIYGAITLVGNLVAISIIQLGLGATVIEMQNDIKLFFTANLIVLFTSILLMYIIKYILLYKTYGKEIQIKGKKMILYIATLFSMLFVNLYTFLYHVGEMRIAVSIAHIILILIYIVISLNFTFLENEFYYQKTLYKNQQEYLMMIEKLLNGHRELKHGWRNYLTGFSGFLYTEEKDWDGMVKYYESVVKATSHLSNDALIETIDKKQREITLKNGTRLSVSENEEMKRKPKEDWRGE